MDDQRLTEILNKRAEQEIPDTMDLRARIVNSAQAAQPPRAAKRLRTLVIAAILLLATATAAFAVWQVIQPDPGIQAVQAENLVVEIDQTQPVVPPSGASDFQGDVNDFMVTLDYAYADLNRITVAYQVNAVGAPELGVQIWANPTLTDSSGQPYYWLPNGGQHVLDEDNISASGLMSFDASGLSADTETIDLSLKIEVAYATAEMIEAQPFGMMLAGDTTFEFSLPINAGRTVTIGQIASDARAALDIELTQVIMSPSLTRFDVCYDPTNLAGDAWLSWEALVSLEIDGEQVDAGTADIAGTGGEPLSPDSPCRALTIPAALLQRTGTWTLTISEFRNFDTAESLEGTWAFTFDVE